MDKRILKTEIEVKRNGILLLVTLVAVLAVFGALMNLSTVTFNGGRMPVLTETHIDTGMHFSFTDKTSVVRWYLTDVIPLESENFVYMCSAGDVLIFIAIFSFAILFIWMVVHEYKSRKKMKAFGKSQTKIVGNVLFLDKSDLPSKVRHQLNHIEELSFK